MKAVMEKALERAFVRAMNRIIANKEAYIIKEKSEALSGYEEIDAKLEELQQELMDAVRNNREYSTAEIERLQALKQGMKGDEVVRAWKGRMVGEFKAYLDAWDSKLVDKFDGDLFRKLVEKVKVESVVEVEFLFKVGVEVREVLR